MEEFVLEQLKAGIAWEEIAKEVEAQCGLPAGEGFNFVYAVAKENGYAD